MGALKGKKTYIVGTLGIIGAVAGYLVGDVTLPEAIQMIISSAIGMTVRNAIGG